VLGVTSDASEGEIRVAYRERLMEVHPDHGGSEEELSRVREAKEVMLDE